jgi:hypothetical protein
MQQSKNSKEFRAYLIKSLSACIVGFITLLIMISLLGFPDLAVDIFRGYSPLLVRLTVATACLISISGFIESV